MDTSGFVRPVVTLAWTLFAAAAFSAEPGVSGEVRDRSGLPVPAEVRFSKEGREISRVRANASGRFEANAIDVPFEVSVSAEGFEAVTTTVRATGAPLSIILDVSKTSAVIEVVARAAEVSGSVSKSSLTLLETPQSVSVVPREQFVAQAPLNVQEALRYAPGVRAEQYGFDARGDWASIRGGSSGQFLNGMRNLFGSYNNVRPEPFALEQIEVMRGPSSVLFGQGGFGGVINIVTKRPQTVPRGEVALQVGSFGRKQIGVDFTGPAGTSNKLFYRLVAVGRDSGTQVHYVPDDRLLAAPAITWRPAEGTRLTLLGNLQEDRMGSSVGFFPWQGTLLPHPIAPIHTATFISEPGFDEYLSGARSGGWLFEHRFASRWTLRQNFNYSHSRVSYQTLYSAFAPRPGFNSGDRTMNRVIYLNKPTANSPVIDTNVETRFQTGFLRHLFLAGADFQQASITGTTAFANSTPIDVFAPVYGNYTVPALTPFAKSRQRQTGIYVQDQIKAGERLSLLLGVRRDRAEAETVGSAASKLHSSATTGRVGLVYAAPFGLAPYFSYTESFLPIAGFDFFNQPFKPQRGKQWETGVKHEAVNGRIFAAAALFDIRETNRRTPDPGNPRNSIQVGEAQSRGGDLEFRARLEPGIVLIGSYAYNLVRVTRSNTSDLGKRLPTMPLHLASVWVTREFRTGADSRLTIGPGIRYTGASFDGNDALRTPAYTLFDAMIAWERGAWRASLNGANLGDKVYVAACLARGDCFYGSRRNAILGVSYRF